MEENVVFELVQGELLLTSLTDVVQPTIQMRTGWSARIETEACDCGRSGPRLTGLHELAPRSAGRKRDRLAVAAHR
jgi:phenylacetate-coenzyme A ligase PaaK-like adenylate-forming protein